MLNVYQLFAEFCRDSSNPGKILKMLENCDFVFEIGVDTADMLILWGSERSLII